MTILVIVESPAKCQKIEGYLGSGYKVMASYGHLTALPDLKHIDIDNNFCPKFSIIESKASKIAQLQRAVKQASEVVIATDDDREGEAIGWHICKLFSLPVETTKRIIFHEITETAIKRAIGVPTILNQPIINAQQGRQILDLLVGFKLSPILWKNIVQDTKNALSAGRCQTPALRLVYDNYKEIQDSPGTIVYKTKGFFTSRNIEFALNHDFSDPAQIEQFLEETVDHTHIFSRLSEKTVYKPPPEPFITSTIQQTANNLMHIPPKETMQICQRLYETGYITYMRTDCKVYSQEFIDTVKPVISERFSTDHIHPDIDKLSERGGSTKKKEKKTSKKAKGEKENKQEKEEQDLAQEAHEAIRPTKIVVDKLPEDEEFSNKERKLYRIIWSNTMESCMADATFKTFQTRITAPGPKSSSKSVICYYSYTAEMCIFAGWRAVNGQDEEKYFNFLKQISEGEIGYKKIQSRQTLKDLKTHYTEAKLVQLLEQRGIGRPSTFSTLIEKIMERNYVNRENVEGKRLKIRDFELEDDEITETEDEREFGNEKNKLVIKPIGILVIEFLIANFPDLFDYDYTKNMEQRLDNIAKGEEEYHTVCRECLDLIDGTISEKSLDKVNKINIPIDAQHSYIVGKNGPVIRALDPEGKTIFKSIKADIITSIDLDKLRAGEYKLEDLVDSENTPSQNNELGVYKGATIYLKTGKFGNYIEWTSKGEKNRKSMNSITKSVDAITLEDAINVIENKVSTQTNLIREIDQNLSIRSGKFGDYIFYKTSRMTKPQFLKLNRFPDDYKKCKLPVLKDWIHATYSL